MRYRRQQQSEQLAYGHPPTLRFGATGQTPDGQSAFVRLGLPTHGFGATGDACRYSRQALQAFGKHR